ncbi:MAG: TIM barrel protein, partial [Actinobacteria bacterium]|nr:TIM barrel protein [Actinomycetota bacterium]
MLLALSTLLYINENPQNGVDFSGINTAGINNVELSFPVHANELTLKKIYNQGLKVISGHADFINMDISSPDKKLRQNSINIIKERILFLKEAGGKFLVVHPGDFCQTEEERSIRLGFSINSLDEILPYAEKNGVCIAIENMPNSF